MYTRARWIGVIQRIRTRQWYFIGYHNEYYKFLTTADFNAPTSVWREIEIDWNELTFVAFWKRKTENVMRRDNGLHSSRCISTDGTSQRHVDLWLSTVWIDVLSPTVDAATATFFKVRSTIWPIIRTVPESTVTDRKAHMLRWWWT